MKFIILASDLSQVAKAPDLEFEIVDGAQEMVALHNGWRVSARRVTPARAHVSIWLDGENYAQCIYLCTETPHFKDESETSEVAAFAAGLFWSAWRRQELKKLRASESAEMRGGL